MKNHNLFFLILMIVVVFLVGGCSQTEEQQDVVAQPVYNNGFNDTQTQNTRVVYTDRPVQNPTSVETNQNNNAGVVYNQPMDTVQSNYSYSSDFNVTDFVVPVWGASSQKTQPVDQSYYQTPTTNGVNTATINTTVTTNNTPAIQQTNTQAAVVITGWSQQIAGFLTKIGFSCDLKSAISFEKNGISYRLNLLDTNIASVNLLYADLAIPTVYLSVSYKNQTGVEEVEISENEILITPISGQQVKHSLKQVPVVDSNNANTTTKPPADTNPNSHIEPELLEETTVPAEEKK